MQRPLGLDFGTTNSAVAVADGAGKVTLAHYMPGGSDTFRSLLYYNLQYRDPRGRPLPVAGPRAIERYLGADGSGRLIQSLKSYLADRLFESTSVFTRVMTLEDLLTDLLRQLRLAAEEDVGPLGTSVVVGRPVHFANTDGDADGELALGRMTRALRAAGFEEIVFEYEPIAAAYYYEERLDHEELVLVADFGGGTSDFTLIEVGPEARKKTSRKILGQSGVGIAGDALDAKILHNVVAPALGLGTTYRSVFENDLDVPVWVYAKLRRWHHLSFLKSRKTLDMLREIEDRAAQPEAIAALLHVIEHDLGHQLYRAVESTKIALSGSDHATFKFHDYPVEIERSVLRADFERWIADETAAMASSVDRLLTDAGVAAGDVDQVFMTGGTSFVPAVRRIFDERFGESRIRAGGELISVASGLALRARDAFR